MLNPFISSFTLWKQEIDSGLLNFSSRNWRRYTDDFFMSSYLWVHRQQPSQWVARRLTNALVHRRNINIVTTQSSCVLRNKNAVLSSSRKREYGQCHRSKETQGCFALDTRSLVAFEWCLMSNRKCIQWYGPYPSIFMVTSVKISTFWNLQRSIPRSQLITS